MFIWFLCLQIQFLVRWVIFLCHSYISIVTNEGSNAEPTEGIYIKCRQIKYFCIDWRLCFGQYIDILLTKRVRCGIQIMARINITFSFYVNTDYTPLLECTLLIKLPLRVHAAPWWGFSSTFYTRYVLIYAIPSSQCSFRYLVFIGQCQGNIFGIRLK